MQKDHTDNSISREDANTVITRWGLMTHYRFVGLKMVAVIYYSHRRLFTWLLSKNHWISLHFSLSFTLAKQLIATGNELGILSFSGVGSYFTRINANTLSNAPGVSYIVYVSVGRGELLPPAVAKNEKSDRSSNNTSKTMKSSKSAPRLRVIWAATMRHQPSTEVISLLRASRHARLVVSSDVIASNTRNLIKCLVKS